MRLVAIGGSDAGITAALRARELDPSAEVTVVLADAYPNFSICGIPYYVSGDVADWRNLAHRTVADLQATGMTLRVDTVARAIDPDRHRVLLAGAAGEESVEYDALIIGTGALPVTPPIAGLDRLGPDDGVHLLHSMADTFALIRTLEQKQVQRAVIVGAGYVGLEMAEALVARGLEVTQLEQLPEVLPTVDPELGGLVRAELERNTVSVSCETRVDAIATAPEGSAGRLEVSATGPDGQPARYPADLVLVSVGVRPDSELAASAGAELGIKGAIVVDRQMRTNLPDVFAAGDCVITHHRLLGTSYLPLGTTAHKQGRVAGENALGGSREFAGSLGTQSRQGLQPHRRAHRPARPRSRRSRLRPAHRHLHGRRPQGLLPRQPPNHDALHRRPPHRPAPRRPTRRPPRQRDRQTNRHPRHSHLQRDDRRRPVRPGPLLHATTRLTLGRAPDRRPSLDPIRTALTA